MRLYQQAQFVGILSCIVVSGTIVLTASPKRSDITLAAPDIEIEVAKDFTAEVTAYSSSPDETFGDGLITASGREVHDGLVACPRKYPFGTRFKIGSRVYTCWDRLHPRFDHRFDIWKPSKEDALQFGLRRMTVEAM